MTQLAAEVSLTSGGSPAWWTVWPKPATSNASDCPTDRRSVHVPLTPQGVAARWRRRPPNTSKGLDRHLLGPAGPIRALDWPWR